MYKLPEDILYTVINCRIIDKYQISDRDKPHDTDKVAYGIILKQSMILLSATARCHYINTAK